MNQFKENLEKIITHFHAMISELRTGRATPVIVENIMVEYYGTETPLKAVASISIPEPRQILIKPWDKNVIPAIQKAIQTSNIGLNPVVDQETIRLTLPLLTEERRKDFVKLAKQRAEEARIAIRKVREENMKDIEQKEKNSEISENDKFRMKGEVQKIVDEYNKKIDEMVGNKEKEIMTI